MLSLEGGVIDRIVFSWLHWRVMRIADVMTAVRIAEKNARRDAEYKIAERCAARYERLRLKANRLGGKMHAILVKNS